MKASNWFAVIAAGAVLAGVATTASAQMANTPGPNGSTPSADVTVAQAAGGASASKKAPAPDLTACSTGAQRNSAAK